MMPTQLREVLCNRVLPFPSQVTLYRYVSSGGWWEWFSELCVCGYLGDGVQVQIFLLII